MLARQKIFHRVTEAFDANAQFVPATLRLRPQGAFVQIVGGCPLFERQVQVYDAPRTHSRRALRQSSRPLAPLLAVKLIEIFEGALLAVSLTRAHVIEQPGRNRIARRSVSGNRVAR